MPKKKIIADGDISQEWRALWVECRSDDGWIPRTDHWPFGLTLKPGVDPAALRLQVCAELKWDAATLLDGTPIEAITWEPEEIHFVEYLR